jgi:hypothetical protein
MKIVSADRQTLCYLDKERSRISDVLPTCLGFGRRHVPNALMHFSPKEMKSIPTVLRPWCYANRTMQFARMFIRNETSITPHWG